MKLFKRNTRGRLDFTEEGMNLLNDYYINHYREKMTEKDVLALKKRLNKAMITTECDTKGNMLLYCNKDTDNMLEISFEDALKLITEEEMMACLLLTSLSVCARCDCVHIDCSKKRHSDEELDEQLEMAETHYKYIDEALVMFGKDCGLDSEFAPFWTYCKMNNIDIQDANNDTVYKYVHAYKGEFDSDEDFCRELIKKTNWCNAEVMTYLNWDKLCDDFMKDYKKYDGYYFENV